jgi:hypothetical protein
MTTASLGANTAHSMVQLFIVYISMTLTEVADPQFPDLLTP